MKKKIMASLMACVIGVSLISCSSSANENETTTEAQNQDRTILRIATTTSLYNTGLLDELEEDFESKYPYDVEYTVVGSGAAIESGANGEADGIFVHSKADEEELVASGASLGRNTIMYNYFEIVGPEELTTVTLDETLDYIRKNGTFVSRGDNSGTNVKELAMWDGNLPDDYIETGKGMYDTLVVADEMGAFTLTDDATFIANKDDFNNLVEVYRDDEFFKNEYSYHVINPEMNEYMNEEGAEDFLEYLETDETLELIANYGVEEYGQPLYYLSE